MVEAPILERKKKASHTALNNIAEKRILVNRETPSHGQHSAQAYLGAYLFFGHHTWSEGCIWIQETPTKRQRATGKKEKKNRSKGKKMLLNPNRKEDNIGTWL